MVDKAKPIVYKGEAEDCLERLKQHNRTKEFWSYAVVMISKISTFTKSHAKYLEHTAVEQAKESNRYETENLITPNTLLTPWRWKLICLIALIQ